MSKLVPVAIPRIAAKTWSFLVVDAVSASTVFDLDTITLGSWIDDTFLPELNAYYGAHVQRRGTPPATAAAIYMLRPSDPLYSIVPTQALALASTGLISTQDWVRYVHTDGSLWILGERANALRLAGYALLRVLGKRYLMPEIEVYAPSRPLTTQVRTYAMPSISWGADTTQWDIPGAPGQAGITARWASLAAKQSTPLASNNSSGDGDWGFNYFKQHELRSDTGQMAFDGVGRGHTPFGDLDGQCRSPNDGRLTFRLCQTHTGSFSGSFPPAASGVSPWNSYARSGPACTVGTSDAYATSTTTLTIGGGVQSLTTQTLLKISPGYIITAKSGTAWMKGAATSYNAGTGSLSFAPTATNGSGTFSSWDIFVDQGVNDENISVWPRLDFVGFSGCWSGLAKLHGEFHRDNVAERLKTLGPRHPDTLIESVSPNDGATSCLSSGKCDAYLSNWLPYVSSMTELQLSRRASPGDRQAHLANSTGGFMQYAYQSAPVNQRPKAGYSAYTLHGQVPSIPIAPYVHVDVVYDSILDIYNSEELRAQWAAKPGGTRGLVPLWGYTRYYGDVPYFRFHVGNIIQECIDLGWQRFQNLGTLSLCLAPVYYGVNAYVNGEIASVSAGVDEWFALMYGPIAPQVQAIWTRWHDRAPWPKSFETSSLFEDSYHDVAVVAGALVALMPTVAGLSNFYKQNFSELQAYCHYLRLRADYYGSFWNYRLDQSNTTKQAAYAAAAESLMMWLWRLGGPKSSYNTLIESPHIAAFIRGDGSARDNIPTNPTALYSAPTPANLFQDLRDRWNNASLSSAGIVAALAAGAPTQSELDTLTTANAGLSPIVTERLPSSYSATFVATGSTASTTVQFGPWARTQNQDWVILKGASDAVITFQISPASIAGGNDRQPLWLEARDTSWNLVASAKIDPPAAFGVTSNTMTITAPAGQYWLRLRSRGNIGGDGRVGVPQNIPCGLLDTLVGTSEFSVTLKYWFWVPTGVTRIAAQFMCGDPSGPDTTGLRFFDTDGTTALTMTRLEPNVYYATTSHGGQAHCFDRFLSMDVRRRLHFYNCPDVISPSKEQVVRPTNAP